MADTPQESSGGQGGSERANARRPLLIMQQAIQRGEIVGREALAPAIDFAHSLLTDEKASHRDKLRASEFLSSVTSKGIDVAMYLDKTERLDSGKLTENIKHDHAVLVKGVDTEGL